jgi:uncharacterized glyoxalase superfamily protein PhnB
MNIEHQAFSVPEPANMADWYVKHLGLKIVRAYDQPAVTRFLADGRGMMLEIYNNPAAAPLKFGDLNPLVTHLAFAPENVKATEERLVKAGATVASPASATPAGDEFAMLRDPWGFCIQLVKRDKSLV